MKQTMTNANLSLSDMQRVPKVSIHFNLQGKLLILMKHWKSNEREKTPNPGFIISYKDPAIIQYENPQAVQS